MDYELALSQRIRERLRLFLAQEFLETKKVRFVG